MIVVIVGCIFIILLKIIFAVFNKKNLHAKRIVDKYNSYQELEQGLRKAGLEACNLIIGIDCTESNLWQGKESWGQGNELSMHTIMDDVKNPYQQVIEICGQSLERFDSDHLIPTFGFGDAETTNKGVFQFNNGQDCYTFQGVLDAYQREIPFKTLAGPTNFAPIINKAVEIANSENSFHILIIICDGAVNNKRETTHAIIRACSAPLSILIIGVGDGPWDEMEKYDDELPEREWDNVQFIPFNQTLQECPPDQKPELYFATRALQEVPDHWKIVMKK